MTREEIENVVCSIMEREGPDGHVDGSETIADFIVAIQEGKGHEWEARYEEKANARPGTITHLFIPTNRHISIKNADPTDLNNTGNRRFTEYPLRPDDCEPPNPATSSPSH